MALRVFFMTMIVAMIVAPALSIDHMVGGDAGWSLGVNYTAWAQGKDFRVGDTLTFVYTPGAHNVLKVNAADFPKCTSSNATAVPSTSGNDVITLSTPGKKWYICDIGNHCGQGMKLVITVSAAEGPSPALTSGSWGPPPGTSAAADEISPLRSCVWILLAIMAAYGMMD